ncbi:Adenylosuccinate synthetase [Gossypium arboreum]|uniref:Adenylosuccinate synthetase n=3 Tax=Gossypium TaxID=3633 RepID=A0A0B0NPQ4_GOSAR|nr:hypothetical protein ERO13_A07G046000v2 [Gossypium hirsutum]KHG13764.1 Adenylosuccinate synthetase [Gossypium arboreum]TYI17882.1 hypothetical protein ES332_A07G054100v1 [Gossypium tomentosum]TYJ25474.1 hypothetical protein E1A91_A07G052500v1 [Gossypium mustelinum]
MENGHQHGVITTWRQAEQRWQRRGWRAALVKLKEARVCWLKSLIASGLGFSLGLVNWVG